MQQHAASSSAASATQVGTPGTPGTLDSLLELDGDALGALYRGARVPRLADVRGDLRGRMLAMPSAPRALGTLARRWAGSDLFPWRGKSFLPGEGSTGEGINRVVSDRWRLFRFTTFVGRSRAGAFDAVQLDYDHPENPFFIRAIKDEIRTLTPGLWLGQAWVMLGARAHLALYFGLTDR